MNGLEVLKTVQFVVDREGRPAAVQIDIAAWESLLDWLEDLEDRALVKEALPNLRQGPEKVGALGWEEVRFEWNAPDPGSDRDTA
jgi:predicted DNA-binding protein